MKLIFECLALELTSAVVPYIAFKEVAHGMACLSESHQGLSFLRHHLCTTLFALNACAD